MHDNRPTDRKGCARRCIVLFAVLMGLVVTAFVGLRYSIRWGMTAAQRAEMDRFFDEPIELPRDWQEVAPFPDDLANAANRLQQDWGSITDEQKGKEWVPLFLEIEAGRKITAEEWRRIRDVLDEYAGFRTAVRDFVALPGYELECFPPVKPGQDWINFSLANRAAWQVCLESYELGERGKWDVAFQPCLVAFEMLTRHPASQIPTHLTALYLARHASLCVSALSGRCDDPQVLRALLDHLNRLDSVVNISALGEPLLVNVVGELRWYARQGKQVDLTAVRPRAYFARQVHATHGTQLQLDGIRDWITRYGAAEWLFARDSLFSRIGGEYVYRTLSPAYDFTPLTEQSTESYFDLARLEVAVRIHELETGKPPQSVNDFVPRYFDELFTDPFSEQNYLWDLGQQRFYSVGPDKTDNGCVVVYDPTNGTLSAGDIIIPR